MFLNVATFDHNVILWFRFSASKFALNSVKQLKSDIKIKYQRPVVKNIGASLKRILTALTSKGKPYLFFARRVLKKFILCDLQP